MAAKSCKNASKQRTWDALKCIGEILVIVARYFLRGK